MRTTILFIFVASFAFCYSQGSHPLTYCTKNQDCFPPVCPTEQHGVCDLPAKECHCHDHGEITCTTKEECVSACGNTSACCHNSHHCHCDGDCAAHGHDHGHGHGHSHNH